MIDDSQTQPQTQSGFADINGARVYYELAGEGRPLVLIHAGVADSRMWDGQFEIFSRYYRVIRYDQRGFGKTTSEKSATFSRQQDLYDLLKFLGVEKTFVLGLSMGGGIAVDFTLEHPQMVDALIPVASGLSGYQRQRGDDPQSIFEKETFEEMERLWEKKENERLIELEVEMWVDGPMQPTDRVSPALRDKVREMNTLAYTHDAEELKPQPISPPAVSRLAEIKVPTLVIVGDLDELGVVEACDLLADGIENARKVVVHGVAHMVNMEQPEEFNEIVLEFLNKV